MINKTEFRWYLENRCGCTDVHYESIFGSSNTLVVIYALKPMYFWKGQHKGLKRAASRSITIGKDYGGKP